MNSESEIESLVGALRDDLPSAQDEARIRARLLAAGLAVGTIGASSTALALGSAGAKAAELGLAARFVALPLVSKVGVIAAISATTFAGSVLVSEVTERPSATQSAARAKPVAAAPAVRAAPPPARGAEAEAVVEPESASAPATTASVANTAPASQASSTDAIARDLHQSTLAEETRLIDAAFAALRSGDRATAERLVDEHGRRFPSGLLWRERERARARLDASDASGRKP